MRERILDATARLLITGGTSASMVQIAQHAGVATGSIYNYFSSKDDLVRAVYERLVAIFEAAVLAGAEGECTARDRLEAYIRNYIAFFWSDAERAMLFEYLSSLPLVPDQELLPHFARSAEYIAEVLAELQRAGEIRAGNTGRMAGFIGGGIRNMLKWHRVNRSELTEAERQMIVEMSLAALRPGPVPTAP
jgi:TetR/AcrR family transcriptional repressor of multidrug resistance operon